MYPILVRQKWKSEQTIIETQIIELDRLSLHARQLRKRYLSCICVPSWAYRCFKRLCFSEHRIINLKEQVS